MLLIFDGLDEVAESARTRVRLAVKALLRAYPKAGRVIVTCRVRSYTDAIAFTGGIGENSAGLRARCCQGLEFLGVELDAERNRNGGTISSHESKVLLMTLQTNEELIVARRAYRTLTTQK